MDTLYIFAIISVCPCLHVRYRWPNAGPIQTELGILILLDQGIVFKQVKVNVKVRAL